MMRVWLTEKVWKNCFWIYEERYSKTKKKKKKIVKTHNSANQMWTLVLLLHMMAPTFSNHPCNWFVWSSPYEVPIGLCMSNIVDSGNSSQMITCPFTQNTWDHNTECKGKASAKRRFHPDYGECDIRDCTNSDPLVRFKQNQSGNCTNGESEYYVDVLLTNDCVNLDDSTSIMIKCNETTISFEYYGTTQCDKSDMVKQNILNNGCNDPAPNGNIVYIDIINCTAPAPIYQFDGSGLKANNFQQMLAEYRAAMYPYMSRTWKEN
eukprot:41256_1